MEFSLEKKRSGSKIGQQLAAGDLDMLNAAEDLKYKSHFVFSKLLRLRLIEKQEEVKLSCKVAKFKLFTWMAERILIITNEYLYMFRGKGNQRRSFLRAQEKHLR